MTKKNKIFFVSKRLQKNYLSQKEEQYFIQLFQFHKKKKTDSFTQILGPVTFHYFIQKSCFHDIKVCNKKNLVCSLLKLYFPSFYRQIYIAPGRGPWRYLIYLILRKK